MKECEPEQLYDDLDVEITDLDGQSRRGLAHYHRRQVTAVTTTFVILAILLIAASNVSARALLGGLFTRQNPQVSPSATILPGEGEFYIEGDPSWGQLWIDNRPIRALPIPGVDLPLHLAPGQHVLTWRATPFYDQQCILTVPPRFASDSCENDVNGYTHGNVAASIVTFAETLNLLLPDLGNALKQTMQAALDSLQTTDVVQPGEAYVLDPQNPACKPGKDEPSCYGIAKQPLRATLQVRLDTNPATNEMCTDPEPFCTYLHIDCYSLCSMNLYNVDAWNVYVPALASWTFTTLDGQVIERDVPDNSIWDFVTEKRQDELLIPLHILWNAAHTTWHVDVFPSASGVSASHEQFGMPVVACAAAMASAQLLLPPVYSNGEPLDWQWAFASGILSASGCVAVATLSLQQFQQITPADVPIPFCLHRFGVILAANLAAHQFWPSLPVADEQEQRLAQQLAAYLTFNNVQPGKR